MSESEEEEKKKKAEKSDRTKHLLRSIIGVDVDLIHSVHLAEKIPHYTRIWERYRNKKGGVIIIPDFIRDLGNKKRKKCDS